MSFLRKIVSGGQTGVDRAALDWALARGVGHGGWCPAGRLAEDGSIGPRYLLEETPSDGYSQRTEWNVRDSDGTVILSLAPGLAGGSRLTAEFARKWHRPWIHLSRAIATEPARELRCFVEENRIEILNVAGPRDSTEAGVGGFCRDVLEAAFGEGDEI